MWDAISDGAMGNWPRVGVGVVNGVEGCSSLEGRPKRTHWLVHSPVHTPYSGNHGTNIYLRLQPREEIISTIFLSRIVWEANG